MEDYFIKIKTVDETLGAGYDGSAIIKLSSIDSIRIGARYSTYPMTCIISLGSTYFTVRYDDLVSHGIDEIKELL